MYPLLRANANLSYFKHSRLKSDGLLLTDLIVINVFFIFMRVLTWDETRNFKYAKMAMPDSQQHP